VTLAGIEGAEARQCVEALEKGLGQRGKVGTPADAVQVTGQPAAGAVDGVTILFGYETVRLEMLEVPEKLLTVEVR
jgi:hypothetical protein